MLYVIRYTLYVTGCFLSSVFCPLISVLCLVQVLLRFNGALSIAQLSSILVVGMKVALVLANVNAETSLLDHS